MRKLTITIRRTNGKIEVLDVTKKFTSITPTLLAKLKKHTADAGGGLVLSYEETITDDRSPAQCSHDAIGAARDAAQRLQDRGGVSSAIAAHLEVDHMQAQHDAKFLACD
jgi:hypothetical protein